MNDKKDRVANPDQQKKVIEKCHCCGKDRVCVQHHEKPTCRRCLSGTVIPHLAKMDRPPHQVRPQCGWEIATPDQFNLLSKHELILRLKLELKNQAAIDRQLQRINKILQDILP